MLVLVVLAWSPFTSANWLTGLIVVLLVVVGVEAIRRTSLAEEATRLEQEAATHAADTDPVGVTASADSGADAP